MATLISRRAFLAGTSAVALVPVLPNITIAAPVAAVEALRPSTTMWIAGHYGDFDWHVFEGKNKLDVLREALLYHGHGNGEEVAEMLTLDEKELAKELDRLGFGLDRAQKMDGLQPEEVEPHHWIRAGFGASCSRCDGECYAHDGARAIGTEVVCEECMTIPDLLSGGKWDKELAEERLTDWFVNHDCDEASVRKQMSRDFDPDAIPIEIWQKCLAEARAEL
jgi:hypothetical protein